MTARVIDRRRLLTCPRTDTRQYACGFRCPDHTPARMAGLPEPDVARYCPPARCHCGACPSAGRPLEPITANIVDFRAIASGKRLSSPSAYREARAAVATSDRRAAR